MAAAAAAAARAPAAAPGPHRPAGTARSPINRSSRLAAGPSNRTTRAAAGGGGPSLSGAVADPLPPRDPRRVLTAQQAIDVYDRAAAKDKAEDSESTYGGPATAALLASADLSTARSVFEFGHGSGKLALRLLAEELPEGCRYLGVDQSPEMGRRAAARLAPFSGRAEVRRVHGDPSRCAEGVGDGSVDIFLSTYVLDILGEDAICCVLEEAARVLRPGGQLLLVGLTYGGQLGLVPTVTTFAWEILHRVVPGVVGGCRAQDLSTYLGPLWEVRERAVVRGGVLASEVLVCARRQ